MSNIDDRARQIVANVLNLEMEQVSLESSFQEDLGADSLEVVEVIVELEKEFSIDIPDERAERILTVQNAVDSVNEMLAMNQ